MANNGELLFAKEGFDKLNTQTAELYTKLETAHKLVTNLQSKIENSDWEGKARLEFQAFFSLIEQFHKALLEEPVEFQKKSLAELNEKIGSFLAEFSDYNSLQ